MGIQFHLPSIATVLVLMSGLQAHAADASEHLSTGAVSIAASPLASVEGGPMVASQYFVVGASFVVIGIGTAVGNTVSVIVQNTADGSKAVISASTAVTKELGISIGNGVKAISTSTGYALMASGKILAFVPNELGKQLLYQSKLSQ